MHWAGKLQTFFWGVRGGEIKRKRTGKMKKKTFLWPVQKPPSRGTGARECPPSSFFSVAVSPRIFCPLSPKLLFSLLSPPFLHRKPWALARNVKMSSGNVMLLITLLSRGYRTCFYGGNGRGGGRISVKINVCWSEKQNELRRYSFSKICTMLYSTLKYSSLTL